ncbi:hypothetical protein PIB30_014627 [Stylosanthes scabra]|uniref:Uncharacterized protein n=1 Tax=Stylosanthes scabra TaxID=79078 RepID=A0ABU6R736_9FABA|nr:hypothetical protein [Stylosanthes scabra]
MNCVSYTRVTGAEEEEPAVQSGIRRLATREREQIELGGRSGDDATRRRQHLQRSSYEGVKLRIQGEEKDSRSERKLPPAPSEIKLPRRQCKLRPALAERREERWQINGTGACREKGEERWCTPTGKKRREAESLWLVL